LKFSFPDLNLGVELRRNSAWFALKNLVEKSIRRFTNTNRRHLMKIAAAVWVAVTKIALVLLTTQQTDAGESAETAQWRTWKVSNASLEAVTRDGKKAVRLEAAGDSGATTNVGLAIADGTAFSTGVIEVDLKGRSVRPSFLGVAFNIVDEKTFEGVYFRPFNFKADETYRHRAVQYIAWPEHRWDELRKNKPGEFESAVTPIPEPDGWFHARIEVTRDRVRVFLDGARQPSLTVRRLKAGGERRPAGLFVDVAEGLYANFEVKPLKLEKR